MIEIQNVSFEYEKSQGTLSHIDLNIQQGECIVLTGESGCGKTTITKLINGLAHSIFANGGRGAFAVCFLLDQNTAAKAAPLLYHKSAQETTRRAALLLHILFRRFICWNRNIPAGGAPCGRAI